MATRPIQLNLTVLGGESLLRILKHGRARCARQRTKNEARGWHPEPGKHDIHLFRIEQMDDVIAQLMREGVK